MNSSRRILLPILVPILWTAAIACGNHDRPGGPPATDVRPRSEAADPYARAREALVRDGIEAYGVRDPAVLRAMRTVPRHRFVPEAHRAHAYENRALPIGEEQTISQPYIVALMTEALRLRGTEKVLEIGTGSGYQAAVLAEIVPDVYTIEIVESLGLRARRTLADLGYDRVRVRIGDGYRGWPEAAPFDAIVVTAAPETVPQPLLDQLAEGGRLVIPVGPQGWAGQKLKRLTKTAGGSMEEVLEDVLFVPMTGEAERPR